MGNITDEKAFLVLGPAFPPFGGSATITVERSDGGAFAVYSLDCECDDIFGTTVGGSLAQGALGQGDWLSLSSLTISSYAPEFVVAVKADNIVVHAVPIPAAVWLFASALAGLGYLHSRR